MTSLIDLDDDIVFLLLESLDAPTLRNLRLTHSRFSQICIKPIFSDLNRWLTEIQTQEWNSKLRSAPKHIIHTKRLTIMNKPKLADAHEYLRGTIPSLCALYPHVESRFWAPRLPEIRKHREEKLSFMFRLSPFTGAMRPIAHSALPNSLETFEWRHALPISLDTLAMILKEQQQSLQELDISQPGPARNAAHREAFISALDAIPCLPKLRKLSIRAIEDSETTPRTIPHPLFTFRDGAWVTRLIFNMAKDTLTHLRISNEHIRSQMFSMSDQRLNFEHILLDPDRRLFQQIFDDDTTRSLPFVLNLEAFELGNFDVRLLLAHATSIPADHRELLRVNIVTLRRLVLEDCFYILELLANLTVQANYGNVHLTEFALRHTFPEQHFTLGPNGVISQPYQPVIATALDKFLSSFTGLETLSLLLKEIGEDPMNAFEITYSQKAWSKHHKTLKCLVSDMKTPCEERPSTIPDATGPYHPHACMIYWSGASTILSFSNTYPALSLEEIGITMHEADRHLENNYFMLRLFSQFPALRAVHFRNLVDQGFFWRVSGTNTVHPDAANQVAAWANWIALPYYKSIGDQENSKYSMQSEFARFDHEVAKFHRQNRAKRPTDQERPPRPKLRLVVVGDWGYRDQMNLAGPRLGEDWYPTPTGNWRNEEPFNGAWSRGALPVFFQIDWEWTEKRVGLGAHKMSLEDWKHQRAIGVEFPGWRARVTVLEQTTVKGWPELPSGEIKMLDFAWQD